MSIIQSSLIPATGGDYLIDQSLRFDDDSSAYLSKTFASAGNRKTWTWSGWVKRGSDAGGFIFFAYSAGNDTDYGGVEISGDGHFKFNCYNQYAVQSIGLLRDPSAWYHLMCVMDTTQATEANRIKLYINGVLAPKTIGASHPSQNANMSINAASAHSISSRNPFRSGAYFDGYLGEVNFIDGQALTPSSFGETGTYGEWKPIEYSGSYGTNGFYLPFKQDYTVEGFSAVTWTGNGSTSAYGRYIGGVGFNPDMVWIKCRTDTFNHIITNKAFGYNKNIKPNTADALVSQTHNIEGFQTDGFKLGHQGQVNSNGDTFVAWNWDFGNTEVTNNDGSTTGYTLPNAAYGQSVITYTGTGSNATIGHGLSAAPDMIIVKNTNTSSRDWVVYHSSLGNTKNLRLNETDAVDTEPAYWNNTTPSSSVFYVGNGSLTNENTKSMLAYCFTSVSGYSKFGSYTGNGSANHAITGLGFKPAFLLIKRTNSAHDWVVVDNVRNYRGNQTPSSLLANTAGAETNQNGDDVTSLDSNGFKVGVNARVNGNNDTFIYMAFADKREFAYWLDQSGNNNDWTSNNLTESDVMVDSPTNNFATLNPLNKQSSSGLSEGNLKAVLTSGGNSARTPSTFAVSSGKWYWEVRQSSANRFGMGVFDTENYVMTDEDAGMDAYEWAWILDGGASSQGIKFNNAVSANYGVEAGDGDIIMVALDVDNNAIWFGKNDSWFNTDGSASSATVKTQIEAGTTTNAAFTNLTSNLTPMFVRQSSTDTLIANFGQDSSFAGNRTQQGNQDGNDIGDFFYAVPTGFLALCTKNLPEPAVIPSENFNTVLYTGNNTARNIAVPFAPDLVWIKARSINHGHRLANRVVGAPNILASQSTSGENTNETTGITAFRNDGFTLGNSDGINQNTKTFVSWNWKANGVGSANTEGTINTTKTSANVDAGFSIMTWTGTGANATIGHGLEKAPEMVIMKNRSEGSYWIVGADGLTDWAKIVPLNLTNVETNVPTQFNSTAPSSTLISLGTNSDVNGNNLNVLGYAFHSVDGYSKVGSYTGNGNNDGTFVYTGFRPAWVMVKSTNNTSSWWIIDNKRSPFNPADETLYPNLTNAEETWSSAFIDFTSNGFKLRYNHGILNNGNYIYLAFAETPFKYSNAR